MIPCGQFATGISLYTYIYASTFGVVIRSLKLKRPQKQSNMEAIIATLTDEQRVKVLNSIYQKGIATPKEQLAFSSDKLVYLKPFLGRLLNTEANDLSSRIMTRQIVDELLQDIMDEITATCARNGDIRVEKVATEYGLQVLTHSSQDDFYGTRKVA